MALALPAPGMTLSGASMKMRRVVVFRLNGIWSSHERNRIFPARGRRL